MAKVYDLSVKTGEYLKDGQMRNRYETIGAMWEGKNGGNFITLKASFNPAAIERKQGNENIIISLYPPKDRNAAPAQEPYNGPQESFGFKDGPKGYEESGVPF